MPSGFETLVHESWFEFLASDEQLLREIGLKLRDDLANGFEYAPNGSNIFRPLQMPVEDVNVLIVGQDPYPTKGHAVGWAFSVPDNVQSLPASLRNIFKELSDDLGCPPASSGDLSQWVDQGVLLLNRTLTVRVGEARSHYKLGWEQITLHAIQGLAQSNQHFVSILWGSDAHAVSTYLEPSRVIKSVHPSPLSAHRGFFGSKPFSKANEILVSYGNEPINWCLSHKQVG